MNPCILDSITHGLRQEIHENCEKREEICPLNAETMRRKESGEIYINQSNLRLNLHVNQVSSVILL